MRQKQKRYDDYDGEVIGYVQRQSVMDRLGPSGELLIAALEDAVNILRRSPRDSEEFRETRVWLESGCESAPGFSFEELCELVGLDVEHTRLALMMMSAGGRSVSRLARTPVGRQPIGWTKRVRSKRRTAA